MPTEWTQTTMKINGTQIYRIYMIKKNTKALRTRRNTNGKRSGSVTKGDVEIKEIGRYY